MAKKGHSIAKRLRGWRETFEDIRECLPGELPFLFPRDANANHSRAILKAANYFKLDPTKASESELLSQILAEIVFPDSGRRKGSKQWGLSRLKQLGEHWIEVSRPDPDITDNKAAKLINKRYPKIYQGDDAIRVHLHDARLVVGAEREPSPQTPKEEILAFSVKVGRYARHLQILVDDLGNMPREQRRATLRSIPSIMERMDRLGAAQRQVMEIPKEEIAEIEFSQPPGTAEK